MHFYLTKNVSKTQLIFRCSHRSLESAQRKEMRGQIKSTGSFTSKEAPAELQTVAALFLQNYLISRLFHFSSTLSQIKGTVAVTEFPLFSQLLFMYASIFHHLQNTHRHTLTMREDIIKGSPLKQQGAGIHMETSMRKN